jgi:hypothetical protein
MTKGPWRTRERKIDGRVVRWKERSLGNGEVERIYEDEGEVRTSAPAPLSVRVTV